MPSPTASAHFYSATKYAVTALTEGTRMELKQEKASIRVTVNWPPPWGRSFALSGSIREAISPGLVVTDLLYKTYKDNPDIARKIYSQNKCLDVDDIAQAVVYALGAPAHVEVWDIIVKSSENI